MLIGFVGVLMFSLTLPFTRVAVLEMSPLFVALGRAALAGLCAGVFFLFTKPKLPSQRQLIRLAVIAFGVVYGFPIFISIAMKTLPSAHGGIVLGVLPLATAAIGAIRFKERPSIAFWITALIGSFLVIYYATLKGSGGLAAGDWFLLLAILSAAIGYSEGGKLAEEMSAIDVISWALLLTLPINLLLTYWFFDFQLQDISAYAMFSFIYVGLISMYLGFVFWYRGMAIGGVARVGQTQLLQPFLTLVGAYCLLGETITIIDFLFALAVLTAILVGKKTRAK